MKIWRIGSKWGQVDLLDVFKKYKIAFAGSEIQGLIALVSPGDLLCITKGQSIEAVGIVKDVMDLAAFNPSLASQFDYVKVLLLSELYFLNDFSLSPKSYAGQGKQFHEVHGKYRKLIEGLYMEIKMTVLKMNIRNLLEYKKQIILQGPPGTGKTRLAKEIAAMLIPNKEFDPSDINKSIYPGLVISSATNYTEYTVLSVGSNNVQVQLKKEGTNYQIPIKDIQRAYQIKLWEGGQKNGSDPYAAALAKHIFLNQLQDTKYSKLIQFHPAYTYEDFVRGIVVETNDGAQPEYKVVNKVLAEIARKAMEDEASNYVLIIDEINRANLPAVLGELIYALEYRFDPDKPEETTVESMYSLKNEEASEVAEWRTLRLPKNLFIIGTMNTADRSVGHIDYAIRRRFAFVDVHPSEQPIREVVKDPQTQAKALELFQKVGNLFQGEYLNSDFKAEEVQLGHSYFLAEDEPMLQLKLDYEIRPLLKEYIKDGILNERAAEKIKELSI